MEMGHKVGVIENLSWQPQFLAKVHLWIINTECHSFQRGREVFIMMINTMIIKIKYYHGKP